MVRVDGVYGSGFLRRAPPGRFPGTHPYYCTGFSQIAKVLGSCFSSAYGRVAAARVARAASLATTLPRIFDLSFKAISTIVLASFLLVDLGSPQFEAILFAVLACSFYLLESFVDDLEDPFGGSWTVDAALDACDELVDALAVEE